ncbi:MAG: biotin/lipoate A/B protein ligase family protein [Phototrophicaceae bacterium]
MRQWRLIYDTPLIGADNMAIDESIMQSVAIGEQKPTLRLYAWHPLCLSIGYGQRIRDADLDRLQAYNWGIVRRPTGGKAILHGDELTYSVSLPNDHDLAQGDIVASYRRISEALMQALVYLGLSPASEQQAKGNKGLGPVCFEVPSHYEITSGGKKLIGSAQVRRRNGILQHGTLPLTGDITRICEALSYADEQERQIAKQHVDDRATTLASVMGEAIAWQDAAETIVQGFADTFDIDFEVGELSDAEIEQVKALLDERYLNEEWLFKR